MLSGRLYLLTCGTSLASNTGADGQARNDDEVLELNQRFEQDQSKWTEADVGSTVRLLQGLDPAKEVGFRPPAIGNSARDRLPQELSYLWLELTRVGQEAQQAGGNGPGMRIHLLASDDGPGLGMHCAQAIKGYLEAERVACPMRWGRALKQVTRIECHRIEGLTADDATPFGTTGVPNLIDKIHRLAPRNHPYDKVIINLTGGFKGAIPFSTLAGLFIPNVEFHYLFESTRDIITLPQFPVGLDFGLWQRQANLLGAAGERPSTYWGRLDPRMRVVIGEDDGAVTPFGTLLDGEYRALRDQDPFQHATKAVIEDLLPGDGAKDYRARLSAIVDVGAQIWQADKAPMAAEHASRHHHALIDFAQVALLPLRERCKLTDGEVFCLLAALLLHDCGHNLDYVRGVSLFPREVRSYHHYLAWERLGDATLASEVAWDPAADLSETVRWLALYHRKSMGGFGEPCKYAADPITKALDWPVCPPECVAPDPPGVGFLKLVVLLRLIDSCDNQTRRVGPPASTDRMLSVMERDAEAWRRRAERLLHATPGCLCESRWAELRGQLGDWAAAADATVCAALFNDVRASLANSPDVQAAVALEAMRAYDEWAIRDRQEPHVLKHQIVREVRLLPTLECGALTYDVELEEDTALTCDGCKRKDAKGAAGDDMKGEVNVKAAKCLGQALGLGVSVRWRWAAECEPFHTVTSESA